MGLFHKHEIPGLIDPESLKDELLGRARILSVEATTDAVRAGTVCKITLEVTLDGTPKYTVVVTQGLYGAMRIAYLNNTPVPPYAVAVRVDPLDRTRVWIDVKANIPTFTDDGPVDYAEADFR
jgi:hypothetical protein